MNGNVIPMAFMEYKYQRILLPGICISTSNILLDLATVDGAGAALTQRPVNLAGRFIDK